MMSDWDIDDVTESRDTPWHQHQTLRKENDLIKNEYSAVDERTSHSSDHRAGDTSSGAAKRCHASGNTDTRTQLSDLTTFSRKPNVTETYDGTETSSSTCEKGEHIFNETLKDAQKFYYYFWQKHDFLSQWHKSEFKVNNKKYCCAEQYMMYTKAVLLHDDKLAKKILDCQDPRRIKELGRQTEQFSEDLWTHNCLHVVKEGNLAKFRQNERLKEQLFSTYPCILVEASPYDKVWGIGLDKFEPCAWNEATWDGKNLLGYILTEVRDELMCERGIIQERDKKVYFEKLQNDLRTNAFGRRHTHDRIPKHDYMTEERFDDWHIVGMSASGSQVAEESTRRDGHDTKGQVKRRNSTHQEYNPMIKYENTEVQQTVGEESGKESAEGVKQSELKQEENECRHGKSQNGLLKNYQEQKFMHGTSLEGPDMILEVEKEINEDEIDSHRLSNKDMGTDVNDFTAGIKVGTNPSAPSIPPVCRAEDRHRINKNEIPRRQNNHCTADADNGARYRATCEERRLYKPEYKSS